MRHILKPGIAITVAMALLSACGAREPESPAGLDQASEPIRSIRVAIIAKSQSNPVFQAARQGAMAAGHELAAKYGVSSQVLWQTPRDEDAQEQANRIEQLANQGVDGISISCSEAGAVTPAINYAVNERGVSVMCFDSDAPASARFAYFGIDDIECGKRVMRELAHFLDGQGNVAILAGNQTAPNLQRRVQGVREEAANYPDITIVDTFYHRETPQDAAARVEQVMQAHPDLDGWAMVGGWPLFTSNALKWAPGTVKCVSVDALPAQLAYLETGHVQMLLAQPVFDWGYRSVEILMNQIVWNEAPADEYVIGGLEPITVEDVPRVLEQWEQWTS